MRPGDVVTAAQAPRAGMDYNAPRVYEDRIAPRYAPVAEALVQAARLCPGEQVLELGAGTGLVTRRAAPLVAPAGVVVATDRSPAMLEIARDTTGAGRAVFATLDHDRPLPFLPASFDVVLSGLTYVQDRAETVADAVRVLRPGGRLALSMWDEDYLELRLMNAAKARLGLDPLPRPDPAAAARRLEEAGLRDVERRTIELAPRYASVAEYLAYRRGFGIPVGSTPGEHDRYLAALGEEAAAHAAAGGVFTQGWAFSLLTASLPP